MPAASRQAAGDRQRFQVVGLGASAGGIQALLQFFEHVPPDAGMAFVVVLHLSPSHQSNAANIFQGATRMPVRQVTEATRIEPDHVYVIPPHKQLLVNEGYLQVADLEHVAGKQVAIDLFFRALANVYKNRAIGIVLSGTGSDGTAGLARIKEQGGVTFAQNPDDTEYDGMPCSAIEAGIVDFVMTAAEMPGKLAELRDNARHLSLPAVEGTEVPGADTSGAAARGESGGEAEQALQEIITLLRVHTGHDFRHYKRATVIRRIERRLQICGLPDLPAYRDRLKKDADEGTALLNDLLIGVTNFFRDADAFATLEQDVIPLLFKGKQAGDQVRVWVPACSTGEEAYSLAMLLSEHAGHYATPPSIQVFATDLDERTIAIARAGLYPESIAADIAQPRLRLFFSQEARRYRIKKVVRDRVLFASHNLLKDPPFSKLDLISCRNLLIYLTREAQLRLLEMFHFALNPGGYLFLGSSESADALPELFTPVDKKHRIYRAKVLAHSLHYAPMLPFSPVSRLPLAEDAKTSGKRKFSFAEVHQRVLAQYAPPSVIVNLESNIVHMSEGVGRFLRYIGGEPSHNLVSLVLPELRLELRTALFQAIHKGRSVEARGVQVRREGRVYWVNMVARPFHDDAAGADFVLVLFDEIEESMTEPAGERGDRKDAVMAQLEEELQRTKEQLQETIERSETSTEELKASNEELQAINEELRSATEELETSKEELQSVNEELVTVNHELKMKVEETGKVNDDLNNLIASTDIATIFVDRAMHIKRYTPRAADIFNIIPTDVGRSLLDITHRLDYGQLADDAATAFESLRLVEREVRSNDERYYIVRMLPYRTTDDRIEGAVLTFIDITSRRRAEERLRDGERRIHLFAESTRDYAIITSDKEGLITSWNKGAERMFGYAEDEALGQKLDIIFLPEDVAAGVPEGERTRALVAGSADDERWYVRKDGSRLFCGGVTTPLENAGIDGYAKIVRDLTERMQAESRRDAQLASERAAREDVQAESVLKDQFLAVMSHELKQPLNLIHINAEMLGRLPEVRNSPVAAKAAGIIQRSILSQAKIIDDLLDLSRLSTGKLTLALSPVDLSATLNAITEVAQGDAAAGKLKLSVGGSESPVIIHADPVRVEQIIWNLLSNAIKFTPAGGSVAVTLTQTKSFARLDVADTGRGIDPQFLPYVFDIYRQAVPPTTRSKGGLGIGMALVKQLVALHGGRVEAVSEGPGKGARFSVWFPLEHASGTGDGQSVPMPQSSLSGMRILLIDDMEEAVAALKALLEMEGASVLAATSAGAGLDLLAANDVGLIVSDVAMPDMDGYEFIRRVRTLPRYRDVPAIAVTGLGRAQDVERAMAAGFSAHVGKPVSIEAIVEKVGQLRPDRLKR
ncbi:MAG TPA: chemotaxis protein CheB [Noviherbaspirillum sp.]|nr:chemotaxis protein CheB [Noviherbaspirillum sp.]